MQAPFSVLILGGTGEAMDLAQLIAGDENYAPLMSFAGRTAALRLPPIPHRVGGFGGADGLADFLRRHGIAAVVDATHPFAAHMSGNAAMACRDVHVPLAVLTRPAWTRANDDDWIEVDSFDDAARALGEVPRTVFLAIGRQDIAAFQGGVAHRYVVRAIDKPDPADVPDGATVILARGPFDVSDEIALLRDERVEIVVSKNSGGAATYAKIAAARRLELPVVMIRRPKAAVEGELHEAGAVLAWLEAVRRSHGGAS